VAFRIFDNYLSFVTDFLVLIPQMSESQLILAQKCSVLGEFLPMFSQQFVHLGIFAQNERNLANNFWDETK
jgi:hypothetical protein